MAAQPPLHFVSYFAAAPGKVWEGFVSQESNRTIFGGAEFSADLKPGGTLQWTGLGADGKKTVSVHGEILKVDPSETSAIHLLFGPEPDALACHSRTRTRDRSHARYHHA